MDNTKMINARQARLNFSDKTYTDALISVSNAILAASGGSHRVSIIMPTLGQNGSLVSVRVKKDLEENGFLVFLKHLKDSNSELIISWE